MVADPYGRLGLTISGWAFQGGSSRRISATLLTRAPVQGEGSGPDDLIVDVVDEEGRVICAAPLSEITVDPPLGKAPRRLHFPDEGMFETEDRAGIQQLTGRRGGDVLSEYEAFRPRLVAVVGALLVSGFLIWRYGLDILVSAAVALTPAGLLGYMDEGTLQTIDLAMASKSELPEDEQERVREVFSRLLAELPADEINDRNFRLLFRDMERVGPNAFAMPGGTVVMTDQFVERFPQDDVLAGVLGHEIGHVVDAHGLRQLYRSLGIYVLIGFLAGDTGPVIDEILLEGNLLLSLRFSRQHEAEADEFGVALAKKAGFNPSGLMTFFAKISGSGIEPPEWLSTHPSSQNRVDQIQGYIDALE